MSWGGGEYSGETSEDDLFDVNGVTFLASSGDSGSGTIYPSASPYVISVGGTSLYLGSGTSYGSESAWSGSGGGLSPYESRPTYQNGVENVVGNQRGVPDVSADADPNTGVWVYDSYAGGWYEVGGTSVATPIWAGLIAIADQGRTSIGEGTLDSIQTLTALYGLPASDFHDITSGNNGGYSAGPGYDLVTGLGSPIANLLVPALAGNENSGYPVDGSGTDSTDSSIGLAGTTDSAGDVFVAGYFTGTQTFGTTTLTAQGTEDAYVAKYNASGTLLWVDDFGGVNAAVAGTAIAVSEIGECLYHRILLRDRQFFRLLEHR